MKFKELQQKSENELKDMFAKMRIKLVEIKFKVANRQLKNVKEVGNVKKDIARILTLLKQKKNKKISNYEV